MSATLELAKQLIARPSITPDDKDCQQLIADRLQSTGFSIQHYPYDEVSNLWAEIGNTGPLFVFAGHTDVVPPGPLEEWIHDPFTPTEDGEFLYGRGAADMKSSLAAMLTATETFLATNSLNFRLGFLITSDEEGQAINGTRKVIETFNAEKRQIDYCLVGEPSSTEKLGDTIKIGRRGSLSCKLKVIGIKGHVAYPQLASNPIHNALPALTELIRTEWDLGNASFPPTSFQISNIHAGVGANNVIPDTMELDFNLRYSTELDAETIKSRVEAILDNEKLNYAIDWHLSGEPFLTTQSELIEAVAASVKEITGIEPDRSTSGGTSDGRFISPAGAQVVEFGPCNTTIHKINERIRISDVDTLARVYQALLIRISQFSK
ncbi:MAG: succinyl-diaminopimelate desuccinylase [Gammaproteobacteria bacterium]|nr:succinyl-diaminopimelate desuccinylase [Gammaproteobacteria bacterium]MDD9896746.1 succinyl-diaminopimelate desuccinylase [Gammaproteobacteria bacterium]MDD9957772.1 succinyl-diaminopimelate desuccinylase [Gammaproteobacteria bacterium]